MLILFDQGTPLGIRRALRGHTVATAREKGWSTLSNGDLLRVAEEAGFDVLLTTDTHLPKQQNLKGRKLAVVILGEARWRLIRLRLSEITVAITSATPGSVSVVSVADP